MLQKLRHFYITTTDMNIILGTRACGTRETLRLVSANGFCTHSCCWAVSYGKHFFNCSQYQLNESEYTASFLRTRDRFLLVIHICWQMLLEYHFHKAFSMASPLSWVPKHIQKLGNCCIWTVKTWDKSVARVNNIWQLWQKSIPLHI
jgi:hypothetical protein